MNGSAPRAAADPPSREHTARPPGLPAVVLLILAVICGAAARGAAQSVDFARSAADSVGPPASAPVPPGPGADSAGAAVPDSIHGVPESLVHSGDHTEGFRIGEISIIPRNIFDPLPEGRLRAAYRLANSLHLRTRAHTVREQLLFERGAPWRQRQARETERYLRTLSYLYPDRIDAHRSGDSVLVSVETRDVWSTSVEFNLESVDQKQYGSVALTERNLLGLGKSVSLLYREDVVGISRSIGVDDPGVLGSRWRFRYAAEKGASGAFDQFSIGVPFYAEDTPYSYGVSWSRRSSVVRLYENADEVAEIAQRRDEAEAFWGMGGRTDGWVRRLMFSFFGQDRELGETRPVDAPADFLGGPERLMLRRVETEGRLWRPRFIERVNVDRMNAIEDFDVGGSLSLRLGWAPEFLGSSLGEGYARLALDAGTKSAFGFGILHATASSRVRHDPREIVAQVNGRWISQNLPRQTWVAAGYGVLGSRVDRDFQVRAGGLSGLRAYPVQAVAGRRLWRFNLEDRWIFADDAFGTAVLGAVAFTDIARGWGPGAEPGRWFASAGVGFRMSLPRWSPDHVLRVDLAWPIDPARDGGHAPVLSFGSSQAF